MMTKKDEKGGRLTPYVTPAGAWALSLGTAIGWGSLVVTSNTYLSQAGPAGSIAGILLGALVMLLVGRNYHYLMNISPGAGGVYSFARKILGQDVGFLAGWFVLLTYIAVFWANATALPLFSRYFLGDVFRFGKLYTLFDYDVYLGEALLSLGGIFLTILICTRRRRAVQRAMVGMGVLIAGTITVCLIFALAGHGGSGYSFQPGFLEDSGRLNQVILIACISPWAFIGFENISHMSEEFTFDARKTFRIFTVTLMMVTFLYAALFILSVSAYPPQFSGWLEYIRNLDQVKGIDGMPVFYAARHYMGDAGVVMLTLSLLALVLTSLIGNSTALSRLFYAFGQDRVLPEKYAEVNGRGIPANGFLLVALISIPIPFLGRTTIGWIVDVTTIGATIIYGIVCFMTMKAAGQKKDRTERWTGGLGLLLMAGMLGYLLIPNFYRTGSMAKESYLLFTLWGVLGFLFFRRILRRNENGDFGKTLVVWIGMLGLLLTVALIWMNQTMLESVRQSMEMLESYTDPATGMVIAGHDTIHGQMMNMRGMNSMTMTAVVALFVFTISVLLTNYRIMSRKARENEAALGDARQAATTDSMTGVKNKAAYAEWEQRLDAEIAAGGAAPFALVVCDVNGLKHINDTYGHKEGDAYICKSCKAICVIFQHSPVFRIGGDEFAAILREQDFERREELIRQLNEMSETNIHRDREPVVSAGMEVFNPEKDEALRAVFERADAAMYRRKQQLKGMGAKVRE
ncbi:MAG: amino acid permease [Clostridia bacterium]|nr:amino acid permease [Clostridia bacterium]